MATDLDKTGEVEGCPPSSDSLERLRARLDRTAQMADVATGVLHNVGNVLNSISVSSTLIEDRIKSLHVDSLEKLSGILDLPPAKLAAFLVDDPKGQKVPAYVASLADNLVKNKEELLSEIALLRKNLQHLRGVIAAQQSYAVARPILEEVYLEDLVDDALRITMGIVEASGIQIHIECESIAAIRADKHRILQILINLLSNARYAVLALSQSSPAIEVRLRSLDVDRIVIAVKDNGVGIREEHLPHLFERGFTTKPNGHGFGLHASAAAAAEIGGSIRASSSGPGTGACFSFEFGRAGEMPL